MRAPSASPRGWKAPRVCAAQSDEPGAKPQRLFVVLLSALAGCSTFGFCDLMLPMFAKSALGLDAAGFSSLISVQKAWLVPGLLLVPWLLRCCTSPAMGAAACALYGLCMPLMFSCPGLFMPAFVLWGVASEVLFIALNALTQSVDPIAPGAPNALYRLVRAAASVAAPWATAALLARCGSETALFSCLPPLMAVAMLCTAALIRRFPLPCVPPASPCRAACDHRSDGQCSGSGSGSGVAGNGARRLGGALVMAVREGLGDRRAVTLVVLMQVVGACGEPPFQQLP